MHFHLPKPLHNWREFVGEVGIIVIGVLIALGGEQLVERWHWQQKVAETIEDLDGELRRNAVNAYDWLTIAPCVDARLAAIDAALTAARQTGRITPTAPLNPPLVVMLEDTWLNARALQVTNHLKREQVARYSRLFFYPRQLSISILELHKEAAELRSLNAGISPISSDEVGAYQRQVGRVYELLERVELGETLLLRRLKSHGISLTQGEMDEILATNRAWAGECVAKPNPNRQFTPGT